MTPTPIKHKFRNHEINPATRCLIIGTFNPDTPKNTADFFYGTGRNDLWSLLPAAFGVEGHLKGKNRNPERLRFTRERGIDFVDIISEVMVDTDRAHHRKDSYIGGRVSVWRDVTGLMDELPNLERACFTRKTFNDVPGIEDHVRKIASYCDGNNARNRRIVFRCLVSPSRLAPGKDKQKEWSAFLMRAR
ncbi:MULTISPECIES: hypothetical protein [Bradyrhizobium]|uniref:Uracil-DNA glycosylase-like domain-containing protein n=1 Tax=Bradyrhizobium vignae TaxID=1549949 RepID=A0A2U3PU05_9BRAD|nr:hypothetical protein [Bradyrhizobium vignae]RXG86978.1 hypothetical protein EAV90_32790 [Bradyrhizobium vignae]SPP92635.1 conserved protein of unknown function [Bradyrhizobium vignae]